MSKLPLPCFLPLTKLVCCYPFVPPQQVAPAIDALYHPDLHLQFFVSAASGENVPFLSHLCNEFIVCNLVDRSEIRLHGLDISATFFHPWSLLGTFIPLTFAHSHPVWFYYWQRNHYLTSLMQLPKTELVSCLKNLGIVVRGLTKSELSSRIVQ